MSSAAEATVIDAMTVVGRSTRGSIRIGALSHPPQPHRQNKRSFVRYSHEQGCAFDRNLIEATTLDARHDVSRRSRSPAHVDLAFAQSEPDRPEGPPHLRIRHVPIVLPATYPRLYASRSLVHSVP